MSRPALTSLFATVLFACGARGPVAQTSRGVAADAPGAFHKSSTQAVTVKRDAPVPKPTDPDECVFFLRAGSVWTMKADGTNAVQLTVRSYDAPDKSPALSPRSDAVAYSSLQGGTRKILIMSVVELVPRAITDGADGGDTSPTWSPDGRRIAFTRGDPRDKRDLYIVDTAGSSPPTLLLSGNDDHPDYTGTPAWSPDGNSIVFSSDRRKGKGTTLWLVDVKTKHLRQLTRARPDAWFVRDVDPTWSPDSKRIAFSSNRHVPSGDHADQFDIYAVNPDGSGLTRLTDDPTTATDPAYSPDGKRLYFVSNRVSQNPYEMELYVMAAEGGQQRRVTRDERPQNSAPSAGIAK